MSTIDQAFIKAYGDENGNAAPTGGPGRTRAQAARKPAAVGVAKQQKATAQPAPAAMSSPAAMPSPHSRFQTQPAVKPQAPATEKTMPATMQQRSPKTMSPPTAPLSTFASPPAAAFVPPQPAVAPFRAALEVDNFVWPAICDSLDAQAGEGFDGLAEELIGAVSLGHTVIAITGCRRAEGRSSMLLCLARHLSARGLKICLVDADFENGQLVRQLGMAVEAGLEAVISGELPVTEVLVESLTDHMALLPLHGRLSVEAASSAPAQVGKTFDILREHYDLVLVDTGPLLEGSQSGLHLVHQDSGIHAALIVSDLRHSRRDQLAQAQRLLTSAGVELLGIAENFASEA